MSINLEEFFKNNFREGMRYELVNRLAGSCAVMNIPIEECIEFYNMFKEYDDEDRTSLIKRTYRKVEEGKKVQTLKFYNVDVVSYFGVRECNKTIDDEIESIYNLLSGVKNIYNKNNEFIDIGSITIDINPKITIKEYLYLLKRKITLSNVKQFNIKAGIGKLKNRIVFPIYDYDGNCIYYVARAIDNKTQPRYYNSPMPRNNVIWNYYNTDFSKPVFVCEGIINAITVYNYTKIQSIAVLSKNVLETQFKMLSVYPKIYLCFDGDVELEKLKYIASKCGTNVDILLFDREYDVNELTKSEFMVIFNNRIKYHT